MAPFLENAIAILIKPAVFAGAILLFSAQGYAEPGSPGSPFLGLSGHWSGSGTITMTDGSAERIRCRVSYSVNASGTAVQQVLRCASDSYRLEVSSNVISTGGSLSGSWSEATRGISGSISGRASASDIMANVSGGSFVARLDIRTRGERQSVSLRPQGDTDVAGVSITLRKG